MKKLLFLCFIFFTYIVSIQANTPPIAYKGILDLKNWNFSKQKSILLNGEWEFYWKKFCFFEQEEFSNQQDHCSEKSRNLYLRPKFWNHTKINQKTLTGIGYATYRLKVLMIIGEV